MAFFKIKDPATGQWVNLPLLKGDKGDKGEPFIYTDFTQQQLELLVGPRGESGEKGSDGISPHIDINGNWYIGEIDTNVKARGDDGVDGENGQSAYDAARAGGYLDTESAFYADLAAIGGLAAELGALL